MSVGKKERNGVGGFSERKKHFSGHISGTLSLKKNICLWWQLQAEGALLDPLPAEHEPQHELVELLQDEGAHIVGPLPAEPDHQQEAKFHVSSSCKVFQLMSTTTLGNRHILGSRHLATGTSQAAGTRKLKELGCEKHQKVILENMSWWLNPHN